ncbi:MAG: hypothetical protein WA947_00775 [Phormidesmis sp.]
MSQTQPKRAIVIGGSIAGLLSAKVLSEVFDEVLMVERDRIDKSAAVGYMRKLVAKTHTDGELTVALARITHMIDSPSKLLNPKLILKALT